MKIKKQQTVKNAPEKSGKRENSQKNRAERFNWKNLGAKSTKELSMATVLDQKKAQIEWKPE